jgi:biotin carboxylase
LTGAAVSDLPRLAVFHDATSMSMWEIFQELREECRLVWVVGWSATPADTSGRAYKRFGEVVVLTGLSQSQSVDELAKARVDGAVVFSDTPMRLAAAAAAELGLCFHSPETAELLTDKVAQRSALRAAGVAVPAFTAVEAADPQTGGVPFPAVLKPREGAGSRDTFFVQDADQVARILSTRDQEEKFILEKWLPDRSVQETLCADLVSVESVVQSGRISHLAVTGRFPFAPPFRETGNFLPSNIEPDDRDAVFELAATAARALDVTEGILHTEIKRTPVGLRLVEVNGRLGGGVQSMAASAGGPPLLDWVRNVALGEDVGPVTPMPPAPIGFFRLVMAPEWATRVEAVEGVHELAALPGVEQVSLNRNPGDLVNPRLGALTDHVLRVDGLVESHEALGELVHEAIPATVRIAYS